MSASNITLGNTSTILNQPHNTLAAINGNHSSTYAPLTHTTITQPINTDLIDATSYLEEPEPDDSDEPKFIGFGNELDEDFARVIEERVVDKQRMDLISASKFNAVCRLDEYLSKYMDGEKTNKELETAKAQFMPSPLVAEKVGMSDREKQVNTALTKLLEERASLDNEQHRRNNYKHSIEKQMTEPDATTETTDPEIEKEIAEVFDIHLFRKLSDTYNTYLTEALRGYFTTYDKFLRACEEFGKLREWLGKMPVTPDEEGYAETLTSNVIDAKIEELQLEKLITDLNYMARKINYLNTHNNVYRSKKVCAVCMMDEIDTVIRECGHTFCGTCLETQSKCPKCRQKPITLSKVYYE